MILEDENLITTNWLPRGVMPEARFPAQTREMAPTRVKESDQKAANMSLEEMFHLPPGGIQLESVEMSLVEQRCDAAGAIKLGRLSC